MILTKEQYDFASAETVCPDSSSAGMKIFDRVESLDLPNLPEDRDTIESTESVPFGGLNFMEQTIKALAPGLLKELLPELKLAYLYGSQTDGTATPESDVDLAFLSCLPIPSIQRFDIAQELTERFNLNVDLVDLREAGAVLKTEIIMKGHQLVGTKLDADYFAMHVLRDYQDYKYHVADIEAKILQDIRS